MQNHTFLSKEFFFGLGAQEGINLLVVTLQMVGGYLQLWICVGIYGNVLPQILMAKFLSQLYFVLLNPLGHKESKQ